MRWHIRLMGDAMKYFARSVPALVLAVLTACSAAANSSTSSSAGVARVGHPAPSWTEPTSSGSRLSFSSLQGKPVYLNFFATWCGPCNEEAPDINALQKQFASRGLQTIGIDELENAEKAAQFTQKFGLVYPAVIDEGTLQGEYAINGLPVHVFIDRHGVIRKMVAGEMSKAEIAAAIRSIL